MIKFWKPDELWKIKSHVILHLLIHINTWPTEPNLLVFRFEYLLFREFLDFWSFLNLEN